VCVCFFLVGCFVRSAWNWSPWKEVSVRVNHLHLFVMKYGWVRSMFTIILSPCPLRRSISTVDRFFFGIRAHRRSIWTIFFGMNPYRRSISTDFWVKSTVDQISTVFSSSWILIDRRYRPYSQVGESLSTVDIDRDQSTGRLKSNRPIDDTCGILWKMVSTCLCPPKNSLAEAT